MTSARMNSVVSTYILPRLRVLLGTLALLNAVCFGQVVTAVLPGGARPAVNPVTNKIYYLSSNNLIVVDGATNTTTTVPVGLSPGNVVVNPATNKVYVGNGGDSTVTVVDGATNATSTVTLDVSPFAMAIDSILNKIYVVGLTSLVVIDGATNTTTDVPLTNGALDVAVNLATHNVYIPNCGRRRWWHGQSLEHRGRQDPCSLRIHHIGQRLMLE